MPRGKKKTVVDTTGMRDIIQCSGRGWDYSEIYIIISQEDENYAGYIRHKTPY